MGRILLTRSTFREDNMYDSHIVYVTTKNNHQEACIYSGIKYVGHEKEVQIHQSTVTTLRTLCEEENTPTYS